MFKSPKIQWLLTIFGLALIFSLFLSIATSRLEVNTKRGPGSWELPHEGSFSAFKSFADSHLYLGLQTTKGQDFYYNGPGQPPRPYDHYPGGVGVVVWLMFHLFGFEGDTHLFVPQLLPIFMHSISLFLVFLTAWFWTKSKVLSLASAIIFILLPISIYYAHVLERVQETLPFILLALLFYHFYLKKKKAIFVLGIFLSATLGSFFCWGGFFILPVIVGHQLITSGFRPNKKTKKFILLAILIEFLLTVLTLGQIYWADNFSFNSFYEAYSRRVLGCSEVECWQKINIFDFLSINNHFLQTMFGPLIYFTGIIFIIKSSFSLIKRVKLSQASQLALLFFLIGAAYLIFFPYNTIYHEFSQFYLIPFFTFTPVLLLERRLKALIKKHVFFVFLIIAGTLLVMFFMERGMIYKRYVYPNTTPNIILQYFNP